MESISWCDAVRRPQLSFMNFGFRARYFVPQAKSTSDNPHPLVNRFLGVAAGMK